MSGYNGWTNKETWLVNLWLGDHFVELSELSEGGQIITAAFIRETVEYICESETKSVEGRFLMDILNCALGAINYDELERHYKPVERVA
jgi:hypothetical protein